MDKVSLRCEDEPIHLCGRIQEFGFLLVFDSDLSCTAASENVVQWLRLSAQELLGCALSSCLDKLSISPFDVKQLFSLFEKDPLFREVSEVTIQGTLFYLSIHQRGGLLYLEFEQCNPSKPSSTKLYSHARYLDAATENLWFALCESIYHVIGFDRVMIYKFMDDGSGQVIAEKTADDMSSLLDYRYPESDIPAQARQLYSQFIARHTVDVNADTYAILGRDIDALDLGRCSIRALSPIHLQYLRNADVAASASFSILVDGHLWGLVACQHRIPRMIDLGQRHLCVFLVQYTVNRHLAYQRNLDLQYNKRIKTLESDLKETLLVNPDILAVLRDHAGPLCDMAGADGLIIKHPEGTYRYGSCPNREHFENIQQVISLRGTKELAAYQQLQVDSPQGYLFPGVAKVDILNIPKLTLYWFRKAIEAEETWAGNPEKHYRYDTSTGLNYPSPRTSFEAWKRTVQGQSPSWKKRELLFMRRVKYTVQDAVMKRMSEIQVLNEKLVELNSTLDTYSYTLSHDLKNPLSAIKLAAQIIQQRNNLPDDFLKKISGNVLDAVELMSSMIHRISEFSKSKSFDFTPRIVDPEVLIHKIIADGKKAYPNAAMDIKIGTLHPFLGEKNLAYQLFSNVLTNAIKYSSKKQSPKVHIESHKAHGHIVYHIIDNGIGIPADELDTIFEIFKRTSNAAAFEGAGIGLSIAKRIADRLGAQLAVKSVLGCETIFILKFKANVGEPLMNSKPSIRPRLAKG
ncbi:ATP-binding protein [Sphingobacterium yanglingense]|uniref:histidine kinase n=1 Tax=Sphingobacterium yanglingense TaxID=1437280 RepID=A0A4R6WIN4_9SPHI|nr:ATP-binding protein [Sphingobacterium yanglingense]TDQ80024.1 light-regulated signal transduction histidine kinase (bacteriophytochrome) [Sphingobacterium yanglingense]